jgi:prepilin-type N-terminal cleavage/methylation domain-containing protein
MILPSKNLSKAFTLIELLMVVSILTIVAGITIPSFTGYMKNQTLKNAQEQFKSDLRSIQNLALTGSKYDTNVSGSPAKYWVMKWATNSSSSSYKSYLVSDFGAAFEATCAGLVAGQQASFSLPSSISFDRSISSSLISQCAHECLFFNMYDGSTRFVSYTGSAVCNTNNQDQVKIILKNESGSTAPVSWNRNGMIGN